MIVKIKYLKNVGKFYLFDAKGNGLNWGNNTFFYAPNAYGKSTLVNVLRSLHENNPKLICARKTLGKVADPEAVIVIESRNCVFNKMGWDKPFSTIQIFDAPFIYENILAHDIGHEHKKNIHRIIIGKKGIKFAKELTDLKSKEKVKNQEIANLTNHLNRGGFTLSMDKLLAIPFTEESAVSTRIQKLEQDIKSKASETIVQSLNFPRQLNAPFFDLDIAKTLTAKKLITIHETAEKQVLAHIDRNIKDKRQAKQFIKAGLDLMQLNCPFCGQDIRNAVDLMNAYREFFDETFRSYQQSVANQVNFLEKWNLDNELTTLVSIHNTNLATMRQWQPYLDVRALPDVSSSIERHRVRLAQLKTKVQSEIEKKQKDPNVDVDLSQFDTFAFELDTLKDTINKYNTSVANFTKNAKQYIADLPKSDIASLRQKLAQEQQIKRWFAPEWKKWGANYLLAKKAANDLLNKKIVKQKELEDYTKNIFDTYQTRINQLLLTFGTDFQITNLTSKTDARANESYSDFGFLILEQNVPLTTRQDNLPCFKNTLSEGDKTTLAFAFFIAALEKLPDLNKQIVVLDDPLSSLDETRREATARILLDLSPKLDQLCVFTHKQDFLWILCDKLPDHTVLKIRSDKKNGSSIEPFNVEEDRKGEHAKRIEEMQRYIVEDFGPTPDKMQGNIRKIFETVLKTKYYRTLEADIKAKKGFAKLLQSLFDAELVSPCIKTKLFDLCNVTNSVHHGEIIDTSSKRLTRDELIPLIRDALELLEKL